MMSVAEYYEGKNIFLTGGSGFIGKVFIEKLLRCCPGVNKVYILLRPKKGQEVQERLEAIVNSKLFDKLRAQQPDFASKIVAIAGDMMEPELGISQVDADFLAETIEAVFHSAATIRFDEHLRIAVEMNVVGVRKMVKLAKTFKHLEVFVHVSTAYANCDRSFIEESIYPVPVEPQKLMDALEWMDDDMITRITPQLLGQKPNTYTYTKQLAEHLLMNEGKGLPVAIVRPSIVGASWKEPFPGWIDNINGPSGLFMAAGKGLLRSAFGDECAVADIVPVDLPVNMMIGVGWYTAVCKPSTMLVYHCTTGTLNPFSWGELQNVVTNFFLSTPFEKCFRRPKKRVLTKSSVIHDNWVLFSHLIPAYIADFGYRCVGKRPVMVKIYTKLNKMIHILKYFTMRSWTWSYANLDMLTSAMNAEDSKTFFFDPRPLHWPTYIENYCMGTKLHILNEDLSGLDSARSHLRLLRNIRYTFNTVMIVALWRVLIARSEIARNLWHLLMALVFKFVRNLRITSTIRK